MNFGKLIRLSVYAEGFPLELLLLHLVCAADIPGSTEKYFYETSFVDSWLNSAINCCSSIKYIQTFQPHKEKKWQQCSFLRYLDDYMFRWNNSSQSKFELATHSILQLFISDPQTETQTNMIFWATYGNPQWKMDWIDIWEATGANHEVLGSCH